MPARTRARTRQEAERRRHVVIITYTDGEVLETHALPRDHAYEHCRTVQTYPTVRFAEVREKQ